VSAGATEDNLKDVKLLAEHVTEWADFFRTANYDLEKMKERVAASHDHMTDKKEE